MYIGTERLHMAATALASSVFWHGCVVDTRCGSVVFILDSPAAARRDSNQEMNTLLHFFTFDPPTAAHCMTYSETAFALSMFYYR